MIRVSCATRVKWVPAQSSTAYKIKDRNHMPEKQHARKPENLMSLKDRLFVQPGSAYNHTTLFTSIPTAFTRLQRWRLYHE